MLVVEVGSAALKQEMSCISENQSFEVGTIQWLRVLSQRSRHDCRMYLFEVITKGHQQMFLLWSRLARSEKNSSQNRKPHRLFEGSLYHGIKMQLHYPPNIAPLSPLTSKVHPIHLHPNCDYLSFPLRYRPHHFHTDFTPVLRPNYDPL